jgi:hypothetical protein
MPPKLDPITLAEGQTSLGTYAKATLRLPTCRHYERSTAETVLDSTDPTQRPFSMVEDPTPPSPYQGSPTQGHARKI